MPKTNLEKTIEEAAIEFALKVVDAVKGATLQELIALQIGVEGAAAASPAPVRRGPVTPKGVRKGPKPKVVKPAKARKLRTSYPKCAHPGCNKNRFPRGQGYCGEHWRDMKAGKIKVPKRGK